MMMDNYLHKNNILHYKETNAQKVARYVRQSKSDIVRSTVEQILNDYLGSDLYLVINGLETPTSMQRE